MLADPTDIKERITGTKETRWRVPRLERESKRGNALARHFLAHHHFNVKNRDQSKALFAMNRSCGIEYLQSAAIHHLTTAF